MSTDIRNQRFAIHCFCYCGLSFGLLLHCIFSCIVRSIGAITYCLREFTTVQPWLSMQALCLRVTVCSPRSMSWPQHTPMSAAALPIVLHLLFLLVRRSRLETAISSHRLVFRSTMPAGQTLWRLVPSDIGLDGPAGWTISRSSRTSSAIVHWLRDCVSNSWRRRLLYL